LISKGGRLPWSLAVELLHPVPEPGRAREQDVHEHECRERDRERRGVHNDDERCSDETVSETHADLPISSNRKPGLK